MNRENLYYLDGELEGLLENQIIDSFAVNEKGEWGYITKIDYLNTTRVYIGFGIGELTEWVALKPTIFKTKISFPSAVEIFQVLEEKESKKPKRSKDMEIKVTRLDDLNSPQDINDLFSELFGNQDKQNLHKFMQKFLFPGENSRPLMSPDNEFKIDNDDKENDEF